MRRVRTSWALHCPIVATAVQAPCKQVKKQDDAGAKLCHARPHENPPIALHSPSHQTLP